MRQEKCRLTVNAIAAAFAMILVLSVAMAATTASSSKLLYKFGGGKNGGRPLGTLVFDAAGNLYGTTAQGGDTTCVQGEHFCGTVFKLTPNRDATWTESVLYRFKGGSDGWAPAAGLIFDGAGDLYGTTAAGGSASCNGGCGTVFKLKPNADGSWTESVLYSFCQLSNCSDGFQPLGTLALDGAGNLYGTTPQGGVLGFGTAFKLAPNSNGSWTESVMQSFGGSAPGRVPDSGLTFDMAGNLYGTTVLGGDPNCGQNGAGCGLVFRLTPNSDGTWTEHVLHEFTGGKDGGSPVSGLIFDGAGNLYGTTGGGAGVGVGTAFKLTPKPHGSWKETVLHRFPENAGATTYAGLTLDASGNLYGVTFLGGSANDGVVFKLAPQQGGGWAYSQLLVFTGSPDENPFGGLVLDPAGNLFGTTSKCRTGQHCQGTVFEVTP